MRHRASAPRLRRWWTGGRGGRRVTGHAADLSTQGGATRADGHRAFSGHAGLGSGRAVPHALRPRRLVHAAHRSRRCRARSRAVPRTSGTRGAGDHPAGAAVRHRPPGRFRSRGRVDTSATGLAPRGRRHHRSAGNVCATTTRRRCARRRFGTRSSTAAGPSSATRRSRRLAGIRDQSSASYCSALGSPRSPCGVGTRRGEPSHATRSSSASVVEPDDGDHEADTTPLRGADGVGTHRVGLWRGTDAGGDRGGCDVGGDGAH